VRELARRPRTVEPWRVQPASAGLIPGEQPMDTTVPISGRWLIVLGLLGFVAVWTLYGSISTAGLSLPGDMAEAFVWGGQFRFGYNQHPPFWAWIAGAWFMVFPHRNWAFYLLAVINSAIGLVGCWWLIGRFAVEWERRAAFSLLLLTPFYTFLCYKYNANTIFLSIWPWTLYCFIASMETGRWTEAIWFGVTLGIALMSKYYAVTLVITCFAASLAHPRSRHWYRSISPWIAAVVCAVLCLPHLVWLIRSDAPPVSYDWQLTGIGLWQTLGFDAQFIISVALFHIVVVGLIVAVALTSGRWRWNTDFSAGDRVLAILVITPVALTMLFGLLFELKVSSNMTVGALPLAPLLVMRVLAGVNPRRLFRWASAAVASVTAVALLATPVIARALFFSDDPDATQPRQELAQFVTSLWHRETRTRLRIVSGADPYENAIGFYSADHPSVFIDMSTIRAPWVNRTLLERDGWLSVCTPDNDKGCAKRSKIYQPASTRIFHVTLRHTFWRYKNPPVAFDIYLVPPVSANAPQDRSATIPPRPGQD
jgi:4-amino-4-deoxy-L-arabinose transferase-like glycosyltransferase